MDAISKFAFRIFGPKLKMEKYYSLERDLRRARIPLPCDVYVARSRLYALIAGFVGAIVGLTLSFLIVFIFGLPPIITAQIPRALWWTLEYREIIFSIFLMVMLTILLGCSTYLLLMTTPRFTASDRKTKIDRELPYATTFMYALSQGGMNIIDVFRSLSESLTYGEVAKEASMIVRNMDLFGQDLKTALREISDTSPSENFQDLIGNLLSVIESGGSVIAYLSDRSEQYLDKAIRDQRGFLELLGLIAESYVTAFVAGPLFIVVVYTVMAAMNPGSLLILYMIIYAVLPIGSAMFIVLISMMSPEAEKGITTFELEKVDEYKPLKMEAKEEKRLFEKLEKGRKSIKFREFLRNPLRSLFENPLHVLYISVPAGILLLLGGLFLNLGQLISFDRAVSVLDDYIIFTLILILLPLTVFFEVSSRKQKKVAKEMPTFLKKLASANEIGMTLSQSLELIAKTNIGVLTTEVQKIWKDIQWGASVENALKRFANRVKSGPVSRVITLILKANRASGNTREVLEVAAKDAVNHEILREERMGQMIIYVVIIYLSFLVFLFVIATMCGTFLPVMGGVGAAGGAGPTFMGGLDINVFRRIFFHAAIIQGFCSGLIAGQMGEGSVFSGIKHSIIMVSIAYLAFLMI
ncbi:MAG: type II secretion system F family protein [Methanocellales archaeon]|nr:type II secretion system F family protein [Methanocellales archaeon]